MHHFSFDAIIQIRILQSSAISIRGAFVYGGVRISSKEAFVIKSTPLYTFCDTSPDIPLKNFWCQNEHFADLFNSCLFDGNNILHPDSLNDLPPDVSFSIFSREFQKTIKRARDVLKLGKNGECYRILGIENQQAIHYAMPLRCLVYDALTYLSQFERTAGNHRKSRDLTGLDEFLSSYTRHDKLFPCYTIVIYWGEKPWDGPKNLSDMMDFGRSDYARMYFNDYQMYLLCVNEANLHIFEHPGAYSDDVLKLFTAVKGLYKSGGLHLPEILSDVNIEVAYLASLVTNTTKNYAQLINYARTNQRGSVNMCEAVDRVLRECTETGRMEGRTEGLNSVALKMLQAGMPEEKILEFTELSKETLIGLKQQL